jgi:hypothetical protein
MDQRGSNMVGTLQGSPQGSPVANRAAMNPLNADISSISATPIAPKSVTETPGAPKAVKAGGSTKAKRGRKRTMSSADGGFGEFSEKKGRGGRNRTDSVVSGSSEPHLIYPVCDAGKVAAAKDNRDKETSRAVRLQSAQVCQLVLNQLMSTGTLTLSEMTTNIPEVSKETLVAVLEVLDVMGIVMAFQAKTGDEEGKHEEKSNSGNIGSKSLASLGAPSTAASSGGVHAPGVGAPIPSGSSTSKSIGPPSISTSASSSSSSTPQGASAPPQALLQRHSGGTMYAASGFAKGTEFTQFSSIKEQLEAKRRNIGRIKARIEALDDLTGTKLPNSREERIAALRKLLTDMVTKDAAVQDDQLFRAVMEQPSFNPGRK